MKQPLEKRKPNGVLDRIALFFTTWGVGYLPLMPGTFGSAVGVAIYLGVGRLDGIWESHWSVKHAFTLEQSQAVSIAVILFFFLLFTLLGIWAAGRAISLLGNTDPPQAVVDEIIGQLIAFLFVPFTIDWPVVLAGFGLFRLFDIWKPYPIDYLQELPGGLGVCADDILAGVYAGVTLAAVYAVSISI